MSEKAVFEHGLSLAHTPPSCPRLTQHAFNVGTFFKVIGIEDLGECVIGVTEAFNHHKTKTINVLEGV